ncbi:MAG: restriction endonuclease subunit S [Candidatus Latescibacteria bacterium]|nr:restriction endonuclease subunit S [Candidatus Latescibacterota bacterium]
MRVAEPRPIKDFCLGIYDGPHATPREADDGPVFLGIKNITDSGGLDLTEIRHVSEQEYPRWTRRVVPQAGDVVFTYEATLHRYAIIPEDFRGCLGRRVALVRPDPERADSRYLLYYFLSQAWRRVVESNVITGATVDRVPLERFPDFPASLPELRLQTRIADILSAYDDLIEDNRRRMALLEEAARQLYREWFVRLRFPGHEHTRITNGLPEGWERKTLGDLCEEVRETVKPESLDSDTPYIGLQHMPRRSISLSEWGMATEVTSSKHRFREGEILFGKIRPYFHKVGVALVDGIASSDAIVIRPNDVKQRGFVLMTVSSDPFVAVTAQTMREGSKMPRADWMQMQAYPTPLPPDGLLGSFESAIQSVVEQLKLLTFANQKLRAARDLLLPRLMSGEIAV